MADPVPTPQTIIVRLEEAADTLRRLPSVKGPRLASFWPEMIQDLQESAADRPRNNRFPPTPDALSRMDQCLDWLRWLMPDDARLVWMRAERLPWKAVCQRVGMPKTTAWRYWSAAILTIHGKLQPETSYKKTSCEVLHQNWNAFPEL